MLQSKALSNVVPNFGYIVANIAVRGISPAMIHSMLGFMFPLISR